MLLLDYTKAADLNAPFETVELTEDQLVDLSYFQFVLSISRKSRGRCESRNKDTDGVCAKHGERFEASVCLHIWNLTVEFIRLSGIGPQLDEFEYGQLINDELVSKGLEVPDLSSRFSFWTEHLDKFLGLSDHMSYHSACEFLEYYFEIIDLDLLSSEDLAIF